MQNIRERYNQMMKDKKNDACSTDGDIRNRYVKNVA
jgi:hypothetical protein